MSELSPSLYRAGEGEPLVLLHGFTGTWHHWRPVLADLAARYEVVAPTLAGHDGGPPFPLSGPLTLAAATDSLEQHLDELGVETAHIAGNSLGGALALELASRGRARSVVALSPGAGWLADSNETVRLARFFSRQMRMLRATEAWLPRIMRAPRSRRLALRDAMRHGELLAPADAVALCRRALGCTIAGEVIDAMRRGEGIEHHDLHRIEAPVLLAWAEHDRILPSATCSARFREEIAGAEWRVLPAVGHVPMWDDTQLVVDTICGWVDRHTASAPAPASAGA